MGRPLTIKSPQQMEAVMEAYFAECDAEPILVETVNKNGIPLNRYKARPYVLEELALAWGMDSVDDLDNYAGGQDHLRKTPMSAEEQKTRRAYIRLLKRAKMTIAGRMAKYSSLGVYDSRISQLVMATHYGYREKRHGEVDLNWNITFTAAEKPKIKGQRPSAIDPQDDSQAEPNTSEGSGGNDHNG